MDRGARAPARFPPPGAPSGMPRRASGCTPMPAAGSLRHRRARWLRQSQMRRAPCRSDGAARTRAEILPPGTHRRIGRRACHASQTRHVADCGRIHEALSDEDWERRFVPRTASDDQPDLALARTVSRNDGARRTIRTGQRIRMHQENALEHFVRGVVAGIDEFPGLHSRALRLFFVPTDFGDGPRMPQYAEQEWSLPPLSSLLPWGRSCRRTGSRQQRACPVRKTSPSREGPCTHAAFPPLARPICGYAGIAWNHGQWYGLAPVPQRSASATHGPAPVQDRRRRIAEAAIPMDGTLHDRS